MVVEYLGLKDDRVVQCGTEESGGRGQGELSDRLVRSPGTATIAIGGRDGVQLMPSAKVCPVWSTLYCGRTQSE